MCIQSMCNLPLGTLGSPADMFPEVFSFLFVSLKKTTNVTDGHLYLGIYFSRPSTFWIHLEKNSKEITVMPYLSLICYVNSK